MSNCQLSKNISKYPNFVRVFLQLTNCINSIYYYICMSKSNIFINIKAVIAFLIVSINASVFFIYTTNKENLNFDAQLRYFVSLAIIGGALFVSLLYLVNNSRVIKEKVPPKIHKPHIAVKKKKKK